MRHYPTLATAALALTLGACAHQGAPQAEGDGPSLRMARQALTDGQSSTALAIAQGVLSSQPMNAAAMVQAGDAEEAMHDHAKAEANYRHALAINPHLDRARLGLGKMLLAEDPRGAETIFRSVVDANPHNALALTDLGVSLDRQGRWAEAQAAYNRALAIDPTLFSAHVDLAFSLALNGQAARGEQMLREAAESSNSSPRVRADLAAAQVAAGHGEQAVSTLRADLSVEDTQASIEGMAPLKPATH